MIIRHYRKYFLSFLKILEPLFQKLINNPFNELFMGNYGCVAFWGAYVEDLSNDIDKWLQEHPGTIPISISTIPAHGEHHAVLVYKK